MLRKNSAGFTLIELMLVVAIIGALAGIAIPMFANVVAKSQEATTKGNLGSIRSALSIYYGDMEGAYPMDPASLIAGLRYLNSFPAASLPHTVNSGGHTSTNGISIARGTVVSVNVTFPDGSSMGIVCMGGNCVVPPIPTAAVFDRAGWVYDGSGPTSSGWGQVAAFCNHKDLNGNSWFKN